MNASSSASSLGRRVLGLDGAAIDALYPKFVHVGSGGHGDDTPCAICLGDALRRGHYFHAGCAEWWVRTLEVRACVHQRPEHVAPLEIRVVRAGTSSISPCKTFPTDQHAALLHCRNAIYELVGRLGKVHPRVRGAKFREQVTNLSSVFGCAVYLTAFRI
ncbi:hypothetical protein EJB05_00292, partial [Eragrostis curvula]